MLKRQLPFFIFASLVVSLLLGVTEIEAADGESAEALFLKGDYQECLAACETELAENFSSRAAALEIRTRLAIGDYKNARAKAISALRTARHDAILISAISEALEASGEGRKALGMVLNFLNEHSEPPRDSGSAAVVAYAELTMLVSADERKVLLDTLEPAKSAEPKERDSYLAIGKLGLKHHDRQLAAENFRAGLKLFPEDPRFLLGMELAGLRLPAREVNKEEGILGYVDLALQANPNFPEALLYKAKALVGRKDFDGAVEILARLHQVNPAHPEGHGLAAAISFLKEDKKAAELSLQSGFESWPNNPAVWLIVGKTLAGQYRFAEGLVYLKNAAEAAPSSAEIIFALGSNQLRYGELEEGWANIEFVHHHLDAYHVEAFNLITLRDKIGSYPVKIRSEIMVRMSPEDMAVFGERTLALAVRAKETLSEKYGMTLTHPVMVEMLPKQEDFAIRTFGLPGGESFLGVCFGPLITMTSPRGRLGRANWESVLWHEMAHSVTLDASRHRIPRWLSEGISVYEERQASEGWGQGMTSVFRSKLLAEDFVPIEGLDQLFAGPDILLGYYQSSLVVEYLIQRFGIESMRETLKELAEGIPLAKVFASHCLSLEELNPAFQNFAQELAKNYGPDMDWEPLSDDEYKEFRKDPESWVKARPKRYSAVMVLASNFLEEGSWEKAKSMAARMIQAVPNNREDFNPYQVLAEACKGLGDLQGEREALLKLYALDANRSEAALRLLEMEDADHRDAERVLETNPFQDRAYRTIAAENDSLQAYESLLALEPRDASRLHYEVAVLLKDTDPSAARRHVLKALEDNPRFQLALDLLVSLQK